MIGPLDIHMPSHGLAFRFLEDCAARLFPCVRSMLYVGHRSDTSPWWRTEFHGLIGGPALAVIDIQAANLDSASGFASKLIHGDIRTCAAARGFDLVFWDEGPEHVPRDEALATCAELMGHGQVLISCPWGHQPQGSGPNDPEFHHWAPSPADFESIGMIARCFGTPFDGNGHGHGNVIAWSLPLPGA